jgi:sugar lactone lactonase YvrE
MSKSRDIADSAATINYIDGLTSDAQSQIDTATSDISTNTADISTNAAAIATNTANISTNAADIATNTANIAANTTAIDNVTATNGTLTKTFTSGESSTINLTSSVLAPVVSVTKEIPQSGVTNNNWDVNSTTENYTRLNSAPATTLNWVGSPNIADTTYLTNAAVSRDTVDIFMSPDGTQLYQFNDWNNECFQFTLTTAGDVSTKPVSYTEKFYTNVTGVGNSLRGGFWKPDGTVLYVYNNAAIFQFPASTAFSANSVSSTHTGGQTLTTPYFARLSSDGLKLFYMAATGALLKQRNLSTAWDISTASASDNATFSFTSQMGSSVTSGGITLSEDGLSIYAAEEVSKNIYQWNFGTANDISTLTFVAKITANSSANTVRGLAFSSASKSFIHSDNETSPKVYGYSLAENLALGTGSFASADVGKTIEANDGVFVLTATDGSYVETTAPTSYAQVASGSWEMYGVVYNAVDGDLQLSGATVNTFDVSTAVYSQSFSVAAQETNPAGIAFNTDGTKMFVIGQSGDDVNEYTLSTGFDISTASFVDSFSVAAQEANPYGLAFNTDGTKMFVVGVSGQDVNEYTLSTGFDVSTASFVDSFSVAAQDTVPVGIAFNTDGTKMFITGQTGRDVNEYTLSTGFDVSSASFVDSFSVSAQEIYPSGIAFNTAGTKMFIAGEAGDSVYEYTLSTAFDVSTAVYDSSFSVAAQTAVPYGIAFNTDGTKMFVVDQSGDAVYEYSIGSTVITTGYQPVHTTASIDSTYWTDINSMTADQAAGDGNVYYAISTDDRTTWTVIDNTDGERDIVRNNAGTWQYNSNGTYASETWVNGATNTELATLAEAMEGAVVGYSIANGTYLQNFSVAGQEINPRGLAFNADGSKMFVAGSTGGDVNEYTLSTGFDVSTASFVDSFSVSAQESNLLSLAFSPDGTKMYIVGNSADTVFEYTLSTGFDVSTASYTQGFSVATQDDNPRGLAFNTDGTKMFMLGYTGQDVNEYTLSTGFDVSTASFVDSFNVSAQQTEPTGLAFNTDGTEMFIVDASTRNVNKYILSTGFDVSTASYASVSFSIAAQETSPYEIAFNSDGTKMFIVGTTGDAVYEYSTVSTYTNQMDKTQLDAVTDPNHIALGNDLDLAIIFNMTSGTTVPSSDGVAINYDANVLNKGAVLGTDYDFDAPAGNKARITALTSGNFKVRVV